jgi:hypothetical protein
MKGLNVGQTTDVIQQAIAEAAQCLGHACVHENSNSAEGKFQVAGTGNFLLCPCTTGVKTGSMAMNQAPKQAYPALA